MKLDDRMLRLIAVGASITANCQPCLQTNIKKALENGADEQEIAEAVEVGKVVRRGIQDGSVRLRPDRNRAFFAQCGEQRMRVPSIGQHPLLLIDQPDTSINSRKE